MTIVDGHYTLPSVASYQRILGSKMADEKASDNPAASRARAVDRIPEGDGRAPDARAVAQDACRSTAW